MFYFAPQRLDKYDEYVYFTPDMGGLSKEECQRVLSFWDDKKKCKGITGQSDSSLLTHTQNERRNSWLQWLHYSQDSHWLFERLSQVVHSCNQVRYKFHLSGFLEALQLTEYQEGQEYDWHTDSGNGDFSIRKLSIVVQLTDPKEYTGGELQILGNKVTQVEQGTIIIFPSFNAHKVHPVKSGVRNSLVAWASGEPFR